ncbi:MAG: hypothetical protein ABEL76_00205 [Bradymonadaceae bacterium]
MAPFDSDGFDSANALFWGLLLAAVAALIAPLWTGTIPPLTDFGGHMAMADIWARIDEVSVYGEMFRRRSGPSPNLLLARFTGLLHPWVGALVAARLFTSLVLVGTVGGMLAVARVFDRPRWLVFLGLPLHWNRAVGWGMLNYIAVFPFFLFAIAAARRAGEEGGWRWAAALTVATTGSFFAHGLGCLFVLASAAGVLTLSLDRPARAVQYATFAPATLLWFDWRARSAGRQGLPDASIWKTLERDAVWWEPVKTVRQLVEAAHNVTVDHVDTAVFVGLIGLWLLTIVASRFADELDHGYDGGGHSVSRTLRDWAARWYHDFNRHTLVLLVVALMIGGMAMPAYIKMTNVNTRVIHLAAFVGVLLPRPPAGDVLARGACIAAAVLSIGYGLHLRGEVREFDRRELQPMLELIEEIPPGQRVECLGVRGDLHPVFLGRPLDLNCPGLIHVRADSFGGFGFPSTGFNAVTFRKDQGYETLRHEWFSDLASLQQWDYVLVRKSLARADDRVVEQVERVESPSGVPWALYRVRRPTPTGRKIEATGGDGGSPYAWTCGRGDVLSDLTVWQKRGESYLGSLRPSCRSTVRDDGRLALKGSERTGPTIGGSRGGPRFRSECPDGRVPVGLSGRSGIYIDALSLVCAKVHRRQQGDGWQRSDPTVRKGGGGTGGSTFESTCPRDTVLTGIHGRAGGWIDAIGVYCSPIDR